MAHQQQPLLQHNLHTLVQAQSKLDLIQQVDLTQGQHPNQVIH